ncbi:MAG: hypothetical protein AAFW87_00200 [Pseudomonadota bacterium]
MKPTLTLSVAALIAVGAAQSGHADTYNSRLDRLENRVDRRESIRDERVDLGRHDVIEDRIDRRESVRDRAGKPTPRVVNRWERRSWRAHWAR